MARLKTKAGTRLDREKVDALSAEAEQGHDLDKALPERVGPGRPSLEKGLSPRISYRVGESLYLRAKRKAEREGRSVSEIAREALERYVIE
jgi:predicted HicB family RNase H-like nuclease